MEENSVEFVQLLSTTEKWSVSLPTLKQYFEHPMIRTIEKKMQEDVPKLTLEGKVAILQWVHWGIFTDIFRGNMSVFRTKWQWQSVVKDKEEGLQLEVHLLREDDQTLQVRVCILNFLVSTMILQDSLNDV